MKKQTNSNIKGHLVQSAFYLILLCDARRQSIRHAPSTAEHACPVPRHCARNFTCLWNVDLRML